MPHRFPFEHRLRLGKPCTSAPFDSAPRRGRPGLPPRRGSHARPESLGGSQRYTRSLNRRHRAAQERVSRYPAAPERFRGQLVTLAPPHG